QRHSGEIGVADSNGKPSERKRVQVPRTAIARWRWRKTLQRVHALRHVAQHEGAVSPRHGAREIEIGAAEAIRRREPDRAAAADRLALPIEHRYRGGRRLRGHTRA